MSLSRVVAQRRGKIAEVCLLLLKRRRIRGLVALAKVGQSTDEAKGRRTMAIRRICGRVEVIEATRGRVGPKCWHSASHHGGATRMPVEQINVEARMNIGDSIGTGGSAVAESRTLLTKRIVARRLGVCPRTVERLIAAGTFPRAMMVGSARRWEPSDVDRFIARLNAERTMVEVVR